jgi:uncharacterized membrane protein
LSAASRSVGRQLPETPRHWLRQLLNEAQMVRTSIRHEARDEGRVTINSLGWVLAPAGE